MKIKILVIISVAILGVFLQFPHERSFVNSMYENTDGEFRLLVSFYATQWEPQTFAILREAKEGNADPYETISVGTFQRVARNQYRFFDDGLSGFQTFSFRNRGNELHAIYNDRLLIFNVIPAHD
ncbi:MAG: hypothetical protein FWF59_02790 [Turicibacter sp.]|nr:hypothetical protein [Turicibacter sp.]